MAGVEGMWQLTIRTPNGGQDVEVHLTRDDDDQLIGTARGRSETVPLEDVRPVGLRGHRRR